MDTFSAVSASPGVKFLQGVGLHSKSITLINNTNEYLYFFVSNDVNDFNIVNLNMGVNSTGFSFGFQRKEATGVVQHVFLPPHGKSKLKVISATNFLTVCRRYEDGTFGVLRGDRALSAGSTWTANEDVLGGEIRRVNDILSPSNEGKRVVDETSNSGRSKCLIS